MSLSVEGRREEEEEERFVYEARVSPYRPGEELHGVLRGQSEDCLSGCGWISKAGEQPPKREEG